MLEINNISITFSAFFQCLNRKIIRAKGCFKEAIIYRSCFSTNQNETQIRLRVPIFVGWLRSSYGLRSYKVKIIEKDKVLGVHG